MNIIATAQNYMTKHSITGLEKEVLHSWGHAVIQANNMLANNLSSPDRTIPTRLATVIVRGIQKAPNIAIPCIRDFLCESELGDDVKQIFTQALKENLAQHTELVLDALIFPLATSERQEKIAKICDLFVEAFGYNPTITMQKIPEAIAEIYEYDSGHLEEFSDQIKRLTDLFAKGIAIEPVAALECAAAVIYENSFMRDYLPVELRRNIQDILAQGLRSDSPAALETAVCYAAFILKAEYDLSRGLLNKARKEDTSLNMRHAFAEAWQAGKIKEQSAIEMLRGGVQGVIADLGWLAKSPSAPAKHTEGPPDFSFEP